MRFTTMLAGLLLGLGLVRPAAGMTIVPAGQTAFRVGDGDGRASPMAPGIDPTQSRICLAGPEHMVAASMLASQPPAPEGLRAAGAAPLVDIMVVYTPSSRIALGGTAATEALIDSYIVYTNTVYEQSGVHHRFRLVRAQEIDYDESGSSNTDLTRLRDPNDGFMDEVHPLRNLWGADLVSLINTSGSAGVAYIMQELSLTFADSAFSAIGADTAPIIPGLVFAHETAHNMGCHHNHLPDGPEGLFCYSFGYRTSDDQWRTIMSSSPGTFVDFFSSPDLQIEGQPLGVSGDGCPPDAAHNVRSLNEAAATVAQFRPTVVPVGCPADIDGNHVVDVDDLVQVILDWNSAGGPADVNGDGVVDVDDLTAVIVAWGACPA